MIARDLIKLFNGNKRWKAQDLNISEATSISIAVASLKLKNEKFIADISDIIKAYIKNANPVELVNLSKSSFYMRKFNHSKDLYSVVHAECITRFNSRALPENIIKALKSVYSSHGIMNDSPFAEVKLKRN